jgi:magnesium-transporting ATPase (P-type)
MILSTFTIFHVLLSLTGIGTGFIVVFGLLAAQRLDGWTATFFATTVATSVTGFMFPFHGLTGGIVSLLFLAVAVAARYRFHLAGGWRRTYAVTAVVALYLNVFVLIVQSFQKVPSLKALAPTQSEPPFQIAQLTALVLFTILAIGAAVKFRADEPISAQSLSRAANR